MNHAHKPGSWYAIATTSDGANEIYIYDEIGIYGVTAKSFVEDLGSIPPGPGITVRINSPGGSVTDAMAIYNVLTRRGEKVTTYVDALAASAASVIFMAGQERVMPENAFLMIHNPWTVAVGTSDDLQRAAEDVERFQHALVRVYASKTGIPDEEVEEMMDAETWFDAASAVSKGFATKVDSPVVLAASYRADLYRHIPCEVSAQIEQRSVGKMDEAIKDSGQPAGEPAVVEPSPSPVADVESGDAARAQFAEYCAKYGEQRAARYFSARLNGEAAAAEYTKEVEAEAAVLRAAAVPAAAPADFVPAPESRPMSYEEASAGYNAIPPENARARAEYRAKYAKELRLHK